MFSAPSLYRGGHCFALRTNGQETDKTDAAVVQTKLRTLDDEEGLRIRPQDRDCQTEVILGGGFMDWSNSGPLFYDEIPLPKAHE